MVTNESFGGKLQALSLKLQQWNKEQFGRVDDKIQKLKKELCGVQSMFRDENTIQEEVRITGEIDEWLRREEILWQQRSKAQWLKDGDSNTKYFHPCASRRKASNKISKLRRQDGNIVYGEFEIVNLIKEFYQGLFQTKNHLSRDELKDRLRIIPQNVTAAHNALLLAPYTAMEVKCDVYQLHSSKAPGLDGFSALFFHKCWLVIEADFTAECLSFLNNGVMPDELNTSVITLIPKVKNAEVVQDFRPISLMGILAKVISKMLVNIMQGFMDDIISQWQGAFISGKIIIGNIVVAYEVSRYIQSHRSSKTVYGSQKLDMAMAFDRVECIYLEEILLALGFHEVWVRRIMTFIQSTKYCIKVNNNVSVPFQPSRVLRQGDPLSPFLFILSAEWISYALSNYEAKGKLNGIRTCRRAPNITHLLFADGSILFFEVDRDSVMRMKELLAEYKDISGQAVNYHKSEMMLSSNATQDIKNFTQAILGVNIVKYHRKYLGLPISLSRKKAENFNVLLDKFWSKLNNWKASCLSIGGRQILISVVLNALPQYWMSCYAIPARVIQRMHSIVTKFWWGGAGESNKIHWVKGSVLRKEKEAGGLAFKDFKCLNVAFLAKLSWRIVTHQNLLLAD